MISRADIEKAIRLRAQHPIGTRHINKYQMNYIAACRDAASENILICLPSGFLEQRNHAVRDLRASLFSTFFPTHVIELGPIWSPTTRIGFSLYVLSPRQPNETRFAGFEEVASLDVSRRYHGPFDDSQVIFGPGLDNLVQWIEGAEDCGFNVPFDEVDKDRLTVRFHDPNLHAHDDDILSKSFAPLGELCDVIFPRRTGEKGQIYRPNSPGERWPSLQVVQGAQSNVPLHPGDILISRYLYRNIRAVLVDQPDKGVTPSDSFLVIRCKSDLISPEYLITYLHTKFAWSYAERNMTGVVFKRISKRDLLALPVLLPGQEMLIRSRAIYEALFCEPEKEEDHFERIRRAKFEPVKLAETIQHLFLFQEIHGLISKSKLRHLKEIVEADIRELDTCRKVRALKACLVLCGSVLEAVLLEWLSEIENVDYVKKNSSPGLAEIIDKLVEHGVLADPQDKNCHHIREKRNVVHPSKMLKHDPLSEGEVDEVIKMLKEILQYFDQWSNS